MQSVIAYRRFGKTVRDQYDRDKEKAAALGQNTSASSSTSSAASASSPQLLEGNTDASDLEKAQPAYGIGSEQLNTDEAGSNPLTQHAPPPLKEDGSLGRTDTTNTLHSMGTNLGTALTGIHVRDRTTREGGGKGRVFVVGYEGENDNMNPHNWSRITRWGAT